jgi:6-pyruvoyltetrahydropterin/6-carboxytetrahydropterin synthase
MSFEFEITATRRFTASHQLRLYDGALEPRHSHDWRVKVTAASPKLDSIGVVMDFHELDRLIAAITEKMQNRHLNELPEFASVNPSAENVSQQIGQAISLPAGVRLVSVEVWEMPEFSAIYRP